MQAFVLEGGSLTKLEDPAQIHAAHLAGRRLWLDLEERTSSSDQLLAETFKIHPLVCEDIWLDRSVPKIDRFQDYLYIIVHGVRRGSAPLKVDLWVLDIVVSASFVITQHRALAPQAARDLVERVQGLLAKGTYWVAHALIDRVVDGYLPLIDEFALHNEKIEREVLEKAGTPEDEKGFMATLFALRRSIQQLSRIAPHQLEALGRLAKPEFDEIPNLALPYFRDVNDHFVRVAQQVDSYRDLVANTMDAYLSLQSNRMNETMKRLTMISTIMLPLTFVAGVYGMNFRFMPELSWKYGYPFALCTMAAIATFIVFWFKRKRWL